MGTLQSVAGDFLSRILQAKQQELAIRRAGAWAALLAARAAPAPPPLSVLPALRGDRLRVIAEVKRGSPSKGTFNADLDAGARAALYARGGAAAISVLTDGPYFQGSLADLQSARLVVDVPLLR